MRGRAAILLPFLVLGLLQWPTTPSYGDRRWVQDPNDSAGGLDIKSVSHGHGRWKGLVRHTLTTYEQWNTALLRRKREMEGSAWGTIYFVLESPSFHSNSGVIEVDVNRDGSLYARFKLRSFRGYGRAWRPNRRSVTVEFDKRQLAKHLKRYSWTGGTGFIDPDNEKCSGEQRRFPRPQKVCYDFSRSVRHRVVTEPQIRVAVVSFRAQGDPSDEYITIRNLGGGKWDMDGWTVADTDGENRYTFSDITLAPNAHIVLHTGRGEDRERTLCNGSCHTTISRYWGLNRGVWDARGDVVRLRNSDHKLVDRCRYRYSAKSPHDCLPR